MNTSDLLLDQIALQFRIFLWVSISAALIVLAAVMNPNMGRNESCAHLVATEDVRNSLARLGASIAVLNVHAYNCICFGIRRHAWRSIGCWVG